MTRIKTLKNRRAARATESKVASDVNKTADALKSGEGKASSFTNKLKEVKKISFDKVKSRGFRICSQT